MPAKRRAIVSVADKRFLTNFARELIKYNYEILATGGTFRKLKEAEIPVREVSRALKTPEILDGRVKTLHARVLAGVLADMGNPRHVKELATEGIPGVDLVVINFYPFGEKVKAGKTPPAEAVELVDIGGPTLVRAAAKNYKRVGVVSDIEQYREVTRWLKEGDGLLSEEQRLRLALAAFQRTAEFDNAVARYFEHMVPEASAEPVKPTAHVHVHTTSTGELLPPKLTLHLTRVEHLRYGENPHQLAARYSMGGLPSLNFRLIQGQELSYNNYQDAAAALATVSAEYSAPVTACVVKHNNPCGIAIGENALKTFVAARDADPKSAFGGIVGLNVPVDVEIANEIKKTFFEVIVAPDFDPAAVSRLAERKNLRLLKANPAELRSLLRSTPRAVLGPFGVILQTNDTVQERWDELQIVSNVPPPEELRQDILTGLIYIRFLKSNALCVVRKGVMIGAGVGQLSRVDAAAIAIQSAGKDVKGSVLISDGFFPFADTIELAAKAKVGCIVSPAGSKRDIEVVDAANSLKVPLVFAPNRHFLH
jgi:phosphoribosylaminoimidazolecarboxamide formyltransferase/IMP cyclohydrolase